MVDSPDAEVRADAQPDPRDGSVVVPRDGGGPTPRDGGPTPRDAGPPPRDAGPPTPGVLAPDLRVARVDLYQAVRVPLAAGGAPADRTGLPVIANRQALVRVHVEATPDWRPRPITAVLELTPTSGAPQRFVDVRTPSLPSDDARPASLFTIGVPASAIVPGTRYRVRLEAEGGVASAPDASFPRDGTSAPLDVVTTNVISLVLVPFRYDTDRSGRLPDVSDAQLARYRDELTSRFPYAAVDLRVHPIVPWARSTRLGGNVDWGDVNAELLELRDAAGAPEHEYWYGLMAPNTSRAAYCDAVWGSCVTGQSYVATLDGSRVGSGVGFGDLDSVGTLAHELGHLHGRFHAPCGTSGTDSSYPYRGGVIGVWGWDHRDGTLHSPTDSTDLLGYCDPQWISDYTYRAMFERQRALRMLYPLRSERAPTLHRVLIVEAGEARWATPRRLRELPGETVVATVRDARGAVLDSVEVSVLELAHEDALTVVLPDRVSPRAAELEVGALRIRLP